MKLFFGFDAIGITYQSILCNKELGHSTTTIEGWCVTEDGVSGNSLISPGNVENRIPGLEVRLEVIMLWDCSSKS